MLRIFPITTIGLMLGPVVAGLVGLIAPAFDGGFSNLSRMPGIQQSIRLSLTTGLFATLLSLVITVLILSAFHQSRVMRWLRHALSPFLAIPHTSAAFGLAFLIAPSGWIARAVSPWLTGWDTPPDVLILQDEYGIAMIIGLVVKEVPFLLLLSLSALAQLPSGLHQVYRSLGYVPMLGWLKAVFPLIYPQIRLPVFAVLAYSLSVVDVAIILGPSTPPTLAVQITRWMSDPDLSLRSTAAAAAVLQMGIVLGAIFLWWIGEQGIKWLGRRWILLGARGTRFSGVRKVAGITLSALCAVFVFGFLGLLVWSCAGFWQFPDVLPEGYTLRSWLRFGHGVFEVGVTTTVIAAATVLVSLVLVLGSLESGARTVTLLVYVPLVIPQIVFLPGLQVLLLKLGWSVGVLPVAFAHMVFVLPYVYLALAGAHHAWDERLAVVARSMGALRTRVFWRLRFPMLLAPVLGAVAIGFAVSVGQYLPTLMMGGGRVETLTTEALAFASGNDRRAIGVFGLVLTGAALVPFALAVAVPAFVWRNRREMQDA